MRFAKKKSGCEALSGPKAIILLSKVAFVTLALLLMTYSFSASKYLGETMTLDDDIFDSIEEKKAAMKFAKSLKTSKEKRNMKSRKRINFEKAQEVAKSTKLNSPDISKNSDAKQSSSSGVPNKTVKKPAKDIGEAPKDAEEENHHVIAGLQCEEHGGPEPEWADKMVYWRDIPEDAKRVSPYRDPNNVKYITFASDAGGWNNQRLALENMVVLAAATGRTLVLPPEQWIWGLGDYKNDTRRAFTDFFHLGDLAEEHKGVDIITANEFLKRRKGLFKDINTGEKSRPPDNLPSYDGLEKYGMIQKYEDWQRTVGKMPDWHPFQCILFIPENSDSIEEAKKILEEYSADEDRVNLAQSFTGNPAPVDGPWEERFKELIGRRNLRICEYDESLKNEKIIHFPGADGQDGPRMLTQFYGFTFFEEWKKDLWMKRFVRDHMRYVDSLQCAAARVVKAVTERAQSKSGHSFFDSMHVRRGDFIDWKKEAGMSAEEMLEKIGSDLQDGGTIYIATDEKGKDFFKPFTENHDVVYLDDFLDVIGPEVDKNFYGMLDQLITAKGRNFVGIYLSTFSAHINRMRGYHMTKEKIDGYKDGALNSDYYFEPFTPNTGYEHKKYYTLEWPFFAMDFPLAWRDIDHGVQVRR